MSESQAHLVIYRSPNGRDGWAPVKPDEVPEWVKQPDNVARMVAGEMCMKADEGDKGSDWYIGIRVEELQAMAKAQEKRERKNEKRLRELH